MASNFHLPRRARARRLAGSGTRALVLILGGAETALLDRFWPAPYMPDMAAVPSAGGRPKRKTAPNAETYRSRTMIFKSLRDEIDSMIARDPAARSRLEVVLTYPSFHVILWYRLAHGAWVRHWWVLGRVLSHIGRFLTGIEIHPGAKIGRRLFIDHGLGVVIGETAEIGDDVTMYHDVTLGGVLPAVDSASQAGVKRHPTLEDKVIIGSGAQILGPITVGEAARIGANAVVTKDIPAGATAVGNPARIVVPHDKRAAVAFLAYGTPTGDLIDPVLRALDDLRGQVAALQEQVIELEERLAAQDMRAEPEPDQPHVELVAAKP
jgi:serine O-acetyltransferase